MLEEILRTTVGAAISFGIGLRHGYRSAKKESSRKLDDKRVWQEDAFSAVAQIAYGAIPMFAIGPKGEDAPYAYGLGVGGAIVGNLLGSYLWRREDYRSGLSAEDTKRLEALKTRLKKLAITNPDLMVVAGVEELVPYFQNLIARKPEVLTEQLKIETANEVERYADAYLSIGDSLASEMDCALDILPWKTDDTTGIIYVMEFDSIYTYELEVHRATIVQWDGNPYPVVNAESSMIKSKILDWDCDTLADKIAKDKRMVIIAGGIDSIELRAETALEMYAQLTCLRLLEQYGYKKGVVKSELNGKTPTRADS